MLWSGKVGNCRVQQPEAFATKEKDGPCIRMKSAIQQLSSSLLSSFNHPGIFIKILCQRSTLLGSRYGDWRKRWFMHIWGKDEERKDQVARVVAKYARATEAGPGEGILRDRWQTAASTFVPSWSLTRIRKGATWHGDVLDTGHVPRILEDWEICEFCVMHKCLFFFFKKSVSAWLV